MADDEQRLKRLLDTLAQVAVSVELQPTLEVLLNSLNTLVQFDAGGIFVYEANRRVVRVRVARGYPDGLQSERPAAEGIVGEVIRTGQARLVHDVKGDTTYLAVRPSTAAQLTVPLASPRGILGAISLESDQPAAFDDQDLTMVALFAQQAAIVIERVLLHEQLLRESRLSHEISIAAEILQGLIPTTAPVYPGLQVFGRSRMAESVGGDVFDFIPYPENQFGLSIADAKGRGLPAALLAVAHRAMLHALVSVELRLRATFGRISELLARAVPSENFVTAFYGIVDISERRMVYANAGHPPPLVVRKDGTIDRLSVTGPALGFPHIAPMREGYATFDRGEGLVLYTDGVTDAGPSPDKFLEVTGVQAAVQRLWGQNAEIICNGILDEVARLGGNELQDDATVVVVKFD
jgi:sigma-B regulation protein RsbU (phosphoserine phosphatase)